MECVGSVGCMGPRARVGCIQFHSGCGAKRGARGARRERQGHVHCAPAALDSVCSGVDKGDGKCADAANVSSTLSPSLRIEHLGMR